MRTQHRPHHREADGQPPSSRRKLINLATELTLAKVAVCTVQITMSQQRGHSVDVSVVRTIKHFADLDLTGTDPVLIAVT
jgi:hypothetical protein